jgi:hypothetical protein
MHIEFMLGMRYLRKKPRQTYSLLSRNALVHHAEDTKIELRLTCNDDGVARSIAGEIGEIGGNQGLF